VVRVRVINRIRGSLVRLRQPNKPLWMILPRERRSPMIRQVS